MAYLSDLPYGQVMRMHTALPVRLWDRSKEVLIIAALHDFKIFKELFDYDFTESWRGYLEKTDCAMMPGLQGGQWTWTASSMSESVTVSVTLQ